jgi:hypothetical protein
MLGISVVTGLGTVFFYVRATRYFSPMTTSLSALLQPLVAAILVFSLGQQALPKPLTLVSIAAVIIGLYVIRSEMNEKENLITINLDEVGRSVNIQTINEGDGIYTKNRASINQYLLNNTADYMGKSFDKNDTSMDDLLQNSNIRMSHGANRYLYRDSVILI